MFTNSVVFADIIDGVANNTILECIYFNTPIIIRRTESSEEYLGSEYPLFFYNFASCSTIIVCYKFNTYF